MASIEQSITDIRSFLERLVRVEERSLTVAQNMGRIEAHLATLDVRLGKAEASASHSGWIVGGVERLGWLIAAAISGWLGNRL